MALLQIDNLCGYCIPGNSKNLLLNHIQLEIQKGEIISLLDISGNECSLLLQTITGKLFIDEGRIFCNNKDITHLNSEQHKEIVDYIVPSPLSKEDAALTVIHYLAKEDEAKRFKGLFKQANITLKHIRQQLIMLNTGLDDKTDQIIHSISMEEALLLPILRSLLRQPALLLIDAKKSSLPISIISAILIQLRAIQKINQQTVIMSVRTPQQAFNLTDRIIVMNRGLIIKDIDNREKYQDTLFELFRLTQKLEHPIVPQSATGIFIKQEYI